MNFLNKLERKYGKYAISNLPAIMIALYVAGYLIWIMMPELLNYLTLRPDLIMKGQVWRLISWVLVPPGEPSILTIITLYFYYSLARTMEYAWGVFKFNVYMISGVVFTVAGAFLLYLFTGTIGYFSTYYINMALFLAVAMTFPDSQVYLYLLIPIKMKWMALVYLVLMLMDVRYGGLPVLVSIVASLMNFILFFLATRKMHRFSPKEIHRRQEFKKKVKKVQPKGAARHKCAVCGRTELDGDHLEFRYCSKCEGNYEYCQDHLFTHQHMKTK